MSFCKFVKTWSVFYSKELQFGGHAKNCSLLCCFVQTENHQSRATRRWWFWEPFKIDNIQLVVKSISIESRATRSRQHPPSLRQKLGCFPTNLERQKITTQISSLHFLLDCIHDHHGIECPVPWAHEFLTPICTSLRDSPTRLLSY